MVNATLDRKTMEKLLRDAERAHGEYERTLGHRDADWPVWYADHILAALEKSG